MCRITHKLLTIHEHSPEDNQEPEVDLSRLTNTEGNGTYITLGSLINRTQTKFEAFTTYHYHIDANSELASILEPGKKYSVRLASKYLGLKWYAYGERYQLLCDEGKPLQPKVTAQQVNSKSSAGKATFIAVSSLQWPPRILVDMRLCSSEESSGKTQAQQGTTILGLYFTNAGDQAISVQSCGLQRFLQPWGPFQPGPIDDSQPRIIYPSESSILSSLQIIDTSNGVVVREPRKPPPCLLYKSGTDLRPKLSSLVRLEPGELLLRRVDIDSILAKLPDGQYEVRLPSQSAWWCSGNPDEISEEDDDRVPKRHYKTKIPPLILESEDVVGLQVKGGKCVGHEI